MGDRQPASRLLLACLLFSTLLLNWKVRANTLTSSNERQSIASERHGLLRRLASFVPADGEGESRHALRADVVGALEGGQRRRLKGQTCIGTNSLRIGCAFQWGLPQCCDSNPNSGSSYNCQPPLLGNCPSGTFAACCTP
ncbi:hypothetical protein COCSUDRAFT_54895 [Coccomyxa subellipsoidea C-169]|uniref:Granulins domain-containing protein n=1 Tax=Coccomyxa subellipsoidea (strain C-169) TaxID=574566 RepID=I0YJ74_COCSC|nr:hypothetical protein COCSUDRAFT_54895 [Coccomyxa subellipsoidea C-169]EIE18443.1 hypothetical protein COCSUDRAFT_54895 [Coccomyxa subellipsoidea C-169]|eukprot:XP_005642987.1 hypothetical protein COCSUDRAFT_54895 [Coccomyxa subellipsoidea C-169]